MEPQNGGFHLKYAEVMYTYAGGFARDAVGGVAALVIARKYLSAAVELSDGDDVKSLSLLALCCQEIATIAASSGGPKHVQQLGTAVAKQLSPSSSVSGASAVNELSDEKQAVGIAAVHRLLTIYQRDCPEKVPTIRSAFARLLL